MERAYDAPVGAQCPQQQTQLQHLGRQTLGENLADWIGVHVASDAYRQAAGSNVQLTNFFSAFAQTWCASYDQAHRCARAAHDVHSSPKDRVDRTLAKVPAWRQTFGCPAAPKEGMIAIYGPDAEKTSPTTQ